MRADPTIILDALYQALTQHSASHAGYPYNLSFEHEALARFLAFSLNNLGDPYVEGNYAINSKSLEREVVGFLADLYGLASPWGYVTSCGTEGNLYGIWLGTRLFPDATIIASRASHYSIGKAAAISNNRLKYADETPAGEIDYDHFARLVAEDDGPLVVNANIGTTMTGAIDRVDRICEILEASGREFHLHCDGALGGLLEPYLAGHSHLDFTRYPIGSLSVSGHKFIGASMPCGVVLTRIDLVRRIEQSVEYIGSVDTTLMGSRNGLSPLFLWLAMQNRDFRTEALRCREMASSLFKGLEARGWRPLLNDISTTVVFNKPSAEFCRRWQLATIDDRAHVVVMQSHSDRWLSDFLDDLDRLPTVLSAAI